MRRPHIEIAALSRRCLAGFAVYVGPGADERGAQCTIAGIGADRGRRRESTRALAEGAAVNSRNRFGETPLVIALKRNNAAMALKLIDAGVDVNYAAAQRRDAVDGGGATAVTRTS